MIKISSFLTAYLRKVARDAEENSPEYEAASLLLTGSLASTSREKREEIAQRCENGDFGSIEAPDSLREELVAVAGTLRSFKTVEDRRKIQQRIRYCED